MTDTPLPRRVAGFDCDPPPWSKSAPDHRALIDNHEFLADCSRYLEGVYSREQVKKRWRNIDDATWDLLGADNALINAIENMRIQRIRNGSCKRERAQQHIIKAPDVLDNIMMDSRTNPKHKVDAIKALDALADNGPQAAAEQDRVIVTINLGGGDVLRFDASAKPTPGNDTKVIEHNS